MKWDKKLQVPVEGTYTPLGISMASVLEWVQNDMGIGEEWLAFLVDFASKPGYTLDDFLLDHRYWNIDEETFFELMYGASEYMPKDRRERFLDVVGVSNLFLTVISGLSPREEMDLLSRLYFCESDEDLWDVLLDGYGEPQYFLKGYAGMQVGLDSKLYHYPGVPSTASDERLRRFVVYMTSKNPSIFYGTRPLNNSLNRNHKQSGPEG